MAFWANGERNWIPDSWSNERDIDKVLYVSFRAKYLTKNPWQKEEGHKTAGGWCVETLLPLFDEFKGELDSGDTYIILKEIDSNFVILKTRRAAHCRFIAEKFAKLEHVLAAEYAPNVVFFGRHASR